MANIGIDLGTTNSLIGVYQHNEVKIIPNGLGDEMTPSVVGLDDNGEIIVGRAARERLSTQPDKTVAIFKPYMGSGKKFSLGDKYFSVEELSALVLKALKEDAEHYLQGEPIGNVIISVPAYFNNNQRNSVKNAATIAGLKVNKVISEPTAAALSYGMNQPDFESKFIVLDLGGGTFDISLMEQFDGIFDIKGSAGNNRLGGEDFLTILVDRFLEYYRIDRATLTANELANIRRQCENLKRNLTEANDAQAPIKIKDNVYSFQMSNDIFKEIAQPLLDKIKDPIVRVMKDTKTRAHHIHHIVLVGGASRMTVFQDLIRTFFPNTEIIVHDPDKAVAKGATIQSELDASHSAVKEYVVTDVTPYTLGIDVYRSDFDKTIYKPIIERNSPVPISKSTYVTKHTSAQTQMKVDIYQGESLDPKKNLRLGSITINTPWSDVNASVTIQLTYDYNGMIAVDVIVEDYNIRESLLIRNSNTILTEEEIIAQTKRIEALKILPRDNAENRLLIAKLERLFEETTGAERVNIKDMLGDFYHILDSNDKLAVHKKAKEVTDFLAQYNFE